MHFFCTRDSKYSFYQCDNSSTLVLDEMCPMHETLPSYIVAIFVVTSGLWYFTVWEMCFISQSFCFDCWWTDFTVDKCILGWGFYVVVFGFYFNINIFCLIKHWCDVNLLFLQWILRHESTVSYNPYLTGMGACGELFVTRTWEVAFSAVTRWTIYCCQC